MGRHPNHLKPGTQIESLRAGRFKSSCDRPRKHVLIDEVDAQVVGPLDDSARQDELTAAHYLCGDRSQLFFGDSNP